MVGISITDTQFTATLRVTAPALHDAGSLSPSARRAGNLGASKTGLLIRGSLVRTQLGEPLLAHLRCWLRTPTSLPLNAKAEVRELTRIPSTLARALISSSVIPSEKYSFSRSLLMLTNGSTATEGAEAAPGCGARRTT